MIGIADPKWGQVVVGCIVTKVDVSPAELDSHCKSGHLAGFMRPRAYLFVEEIPRNPGNGNVLRRLLRERAITVRDGGAGYHSV